MRPIRIRTLIAALTALWVVAAGGTLVASASDKAELRPYDSPAWVEVLNKPQTWPSFIDDHYVKAFDVYSPAMGREIPVAVMPAHDAHGNPVSGAPTIYLLNGAGGAAQDGDWLTVTDGLRFYRDKGVNVVIPQDGSFSYYTDWVKEDLDTTYLKGPQKWETFLTRELPEVIEPMLNAGDRRGVIGVSMSATSSLLLAEHNPGFYNAVGSFSGCAATSSPVEYNYLRLTVDRAAGGMFDFTTVTPEMMWGPQGGPYNRYNDALFNAEKLRGTDLYISSATGLAAREDMSGFYVAQGHHPIVGSVMALQLQGEGGLIEGTVNQCTHNFKAKLDQLGIPAHWQFREQGTHSWPIWISDLERSWYTVFEPALKS